MKVRWSAPWRTEENHIDNSPSLPRLTLPSQCFRKLDKISEHKLDSVGNTIDGRVVSCKSQPRLIIVNCNDAFASLGKCDCVSAHSAKRVHDGVATAPVRDLVCNELRGNAVPPDAIEETALIIEREVSVSLREI